MPRRLPAGLLLLLVLTAAAALWLLLERPPADPDQDRSETLLGLRAEDVTELRIETAAQVVILRRAGTAVAPPAAGPAGAAAPGSLARAAAAGEWVLDGSVADLVDQTEAAAVVERATRAVAPLVPEAAPDGYGLQQPLMLIRAVARDGRRVEARLGDLNPALQRHYAAVAGRAGVLTVDAALVRALLALPEPLRLVRLWPPFEPTAADTVVFERPPRPGRELLVRDRDGRWWLREPEDGRLLVPIPALERERLYGDLSRLEDGRRWWLASRLAVEVLLAGLEDCVVARFGPAPAAPETLAASGLLPPTVAVEVRSRGRTLRVAFGHQEQRLRVAATRQDLPNLLHATGDPVAPALLPLGGYIELRALHFDVAAADSFRLERHDIAPLTIRSAAGGWATPGGTSPREAAELVSDLVHHLDAAPMLGALPPATAGEPLAPTYRTTLLVWLPGEDEPRRLRLGYLPDDRAVIHEPASGKLLLVRPQLMVTLRSVITALGRPTR